MTFEVPEQAIAYLEDRSNRMRHTYWQEKDLASCLAIATEAIHAGEEASRDFPDSSYEVLSSVKRLCYDIASFTWIGWDEPGIAPSEAQISLGKAMASRNLQLAIQLDKGDLPTSRGYWMVGAHLLTAGKFELALSEFDEAESYAVMSGSRPDVLLCQGFMLLCQKLLGTVQEEILSSHLELMRGEEECAPFADQIETVVRVLAR